jgi:amylovoran biosynthesis glycosyltransferase AmsE
MNAYFQTYRLPSIQWISILISSYNTPKEYLKDCFLSILLQKDLGIKFAIEIVIVNDGSNQSKTEILENILKKIGTSSKFIKIKYLKMHTNKGISYCLHHGVLSCSYNLIFRMDSDDIMEKTRLTKQLDFMNKQPLCVLSGTDMISFATNNNIRRYVNKTQHSSRLTWEEYTKTKKQWIMNHPTLCFRKYAVITVGNYNANLKEPYEDLDLELRLLKKYGFICNLPVILLFYRIHPNQITSQSRDKSFINKELKTSMIENIINNFNHF